MSGYPGRTYAVGTEPTKRHGGEITAEQIERMRANVPDDPVRLQEGSLACRTCGIAVQVPDSEKDSDQVIHLTAHGRAVEGPAVMTQAVANQRSTELSFALCPSCRRTAELAERLVSAPANPTVLYQLNCALDALSFLAPAPVETAESTHLDPEDRSALVRHLANLGAAARWVARFVPIIEPGAGRNTCSPHPWAHVKIGQRQAIRTAYAALLKERVARNAPAVQIPPPPVSGVHSASTPVVVVENGCLFCGIGQQSVPAVVVARQGRENVARDLWTAKRTETRPLGGRRSPATVSGYLCRVCADAVEHAKAVGPTALERALVVALAPTGVGKLGWGHIAVDGLVGWGALVAQARQHNPLEPDPRPNTRPWEHLGDLTEVSKQLGRALG